MKHFIHDIIMRSIKIIDIGYIAGIYFIIGILMAHFFDKLYGKFDKKKEQKKTFTTRTIEVIGMLWLIGVISYFVRNLVEFIPAPYDHIYGYDHLKVKELKNGAVFTFVFLFFQSFFKEKIQFYYDNLDFSLK